jgi:multimeric flavodoxin WrbA
LETIRVLGISGSPRLKGNTSIMIQRCLEGSKKAGATTEFVSLADHHINPCRGCTEVCHPTFRPGANVQDVLDKEPWNLCPQQDDAKEVIGRMAEADAIIVGSPVYFANISAQTKALIDRCTCVGQITPEGRLVSCFKNKIGGAVAVGGCRHGGQSYAVQTILTYFSLLGMFPVGFGERDDQAFGLSGVAQDVDGINEDQWTNFIGKRDSAVDQAADYGRKIVEATKIVKAGIRSCRRHVSSA